MRCSWSLARRRCPDPLARSAALVTVTFPWGSLLDGALAREPTVAAGLAGLLRPGGRIEILASVEPRDGVAGIDRLQDLNAVEIGAAWSAHGLDLDCVRPATAAEVDASHSTWGRRLTRGDTGRGVWRLELAARLR